MAKVGTLAVLGFGFLLAAMVAGMADMHAPDMPERHRRVLAAIGVLALGGWTAGAVGALAAMAIGHARAASWLAWVPALLAVVAYGTLFAVGTVDWLPDEPTGAPRVIAQAIFAPFSVALVVAGGRDWMVQRRMLARSRPVEARILSAEVEPVGPKSASRKGAPPAGGAWGRHRPAVRFEFTLRGTSHAASRLRPGHDTPVYRSHRAARAALGGLAPGRVVRAWADPAHPREAFLFREPRARPAALLTLGLLLPALIHLLAALLM